MEITEIRTTDRLDEVRGNLQLIDMAKTTRDEAEQVELARHQSGLVHSALRSNAHLCEAARNILDGKEEVPVADHAGVSSVIDQTREALMEEK